MKVYKYETDQFGLTSEGIHLLRSRYNYETIPVGQIDKIRFERSQLVNNWALLFVAGLASVAFAVYYTFILVDVFNDDTIHRIYIEEIMVPFLPFGFGLFMIYSSLRTGTMMIVHYKNKKKRFSLEKLRKEGRLQDFIKEFKTPEYQKAKEIQFAAVI